MSPQIFPALRRWKNFAPVWNIETNFSNFQKMEKFCPSMALSWSVWVSKLCMHILLGLVQTNCPSLKPALLHNFSVHWKIFPSVESHASMQNLNFRFWALCPRSRQPSECWTPFEKFAQCVAKFNRETFLGCFLTFLVFSVLTTCSWSLAHLVGLSDALDHSVGRHFLNLRSVRQAFDSFNTFLMVAILPWSLVCLLIFPLAEKLPQCGTIKSMMRPMDKSKVFLMFSPIRVSFLFPKPFLHCYLGFFISRLRYCHRFGRFCNRCPFAWMM